MQIRQNNFNYGKYCQGFTVTEVLTALLLLGVLLSIGVPSFSDYTKRQRVKSEAQSVARIFSSARAEAIVIDALSVRVRWNKGNSNITIVDTSVVGSPVNQILAPGDIAVMHPTNNSFLSVTNFTDSGVVYTDNDADGIVMFNSQGRMTGNSSPPALAFLFCRAANDDQDAIRVEVFPTGRVVQKLQVNTTGVQGLNCPSA